MLLQACLGLSVHAGPRELRFRHPVLPDFLRIVELHNLRIGPDSVDLLIQRQREHVSVNVMRRAPGVRLVIAE